MDKTTPEDTSEDHVFIFKDLPFENITEQLIAQHTPGGHYYDTATTQQVVAQHLSLNQGVFAVRQGMEGSPAVTVIRTQDQLVVSCNCYGSRKNLCEHQSLVMAALLHRDELGIFFNNTLRREKLEKIAADYGLEEEPGLDSFFTIALQDNRLVITPVLQSLTPVTRESLGNLRELLLPVSEAITQAPEETAAQTICVVLKRHKYYRYLLVELYSAATTKEGKIRNPLTPVHPLQLIWQTEDPQQLKFFAAIHKFQNNTTDKRSEADIVALRAITRNPLGYQFYYHNSDVSENITATSLVRVSVNSHAPVVTLAVSPRNQFYELSANVTINGEAHPLKDIELRFTYFILSGSTLYLIDSLSVLGVIDLFKKKAGNMLVHTRRYREFKAQLLTKLEDSVTINYDYIPPATPEQVEEHFADKDVSRIIYLSDFGNHVMIIPVIRYGEAEIPIRSKRQIYGTDAKGKEFLVKRDNEAEVAFTALLTRQHMYFEEQLDNDLHYFYLHKKRFLEEEWFLNAFEEWNSHNITVLGFNEIEGNKLNPHKVTITIRVISGINWFNAIVGVTYGSKKASLKQIYKSIRQKSKYVQLDDGTLGIIPEEWLEKFANYFNTGDIIDMETIRIPKISFSAVTRLFNEAMLDDNVQQELRLYSERLTNFESIQPVEVPDTLQGTLRPYQQEGLNWLNFLDDFNFGGCLADDMGLGKSVQIIAFILLQRNKVSHNTNLLVVPTSLIFNWQKEIRQFAPSIKVLTIHGTDRDRNTARFSEYEVILTSYGTLLSDITFLKEYTFNYIFLDESQNIKNPDSQRYQAARLLQSRNRMVITGTPVENNTFDLYGQLSFACPGLLGGKQFFRDTYALPIDKFKYTKRAVELHNLIKPFILRRTKQQVENELPDKTEMVLYCEMQPEQRSIYDSYEKEFREYISATTSDELAKSPMNVLKGLTRLRQICNSPRLLKDDKLTGSLSAKIDTLVEQIESKAPQHKILVFSQFVSMLELIRNELTTRGINYCWLTGSTRNREQVVTEFQNNPDNRVFLISLKAGGTGLNLTAAGYVYLVDPWWNPAVENQAIDRTHRIGQHKNVVAVRLICPNTVEEKMMKLQQSKKELTDQLVQADNAFFKSLSKTDLLRLLS